MVLLGKNSESGSTCWLFKMTPSNLKGRKEIETDELNVYCAFPCHTISPEVKKMTVQICGNQNNQITTPIYCTVVLFPVQHPQLDFCMGVLENPEIINDNEDLKKISYFDYNGEIYNEGGAINKNVEIIYANKSGYVNAVQTKILDMNYEIGTYEQESIVHETPYSGGYILLEEPAKSGISGSVLIFNDNVTGITSISSAYNGSTNDTLIESKCLAVDMYYIYPHIVQCTQVIHRYTLNDPVKLTQLCNYSTMQTLRNELMPIVCYLGADYVFQQITTKEPIKTLRLKQLHLHLNVNRIGFKEDSGSNTIPVITILNNNPEFVDYYFSKDKSKSEIVIRTLTYYDKIFRENVVIDFEQNTIYANVLDYCFRADPAAPVLLTCQTKVIDRNGSVELTPLREFKFDPAPTTDIIHNQSYPRSTSQLPKVYFNNEVAKYIISKTSMGTWIEGKNDYIKLNYLLVWTKGTASYCAYCNWNDSHECYYKEDCPKWQEAQRCFFGESLIDTDNGQIKIKDIKLGDKIYPNQTVLGIYINEHKSLNTYRIGNAWVTDDHLIYNEKGLPYRLNSQNDIQTYEIIATTQTYNLLTSTNLIFSGGVMLGDYEEITINHPLFNSSLGKEMVFKLQNDLSETVLSDLNNMVDNTNYSYYPVGFVCDEISNYQSISNHLIDENKVELFDYLGVICSGNNIVLEDNKWIRVCNSIKAKRFYGNHNNVMKQWLTDSGIVKINDISFCDFQVSENDEIWFNQVISSIKHISGVEKEKLYCLDENKTEMITV